MSCQWNIFSFPLKNFSSFKFRIINLITVCCRFAHSFKIMCIPQPACFEVVPSCTVERLSSGRGGEVDVWFTRCIKGREPKIYELLTFAEDGIREVRPYAQVQISDNFIGDIFTPTFSMHKKSELLSWVAYLSTEVSNGLMFLNHLVKLELLLWLGLETSKFTREVPTLLGFQMFLSTGVQLFQIFLSTCALLHAAPVTIHVYTPASLL